LGSWGTTPSRVTGHSSGEIAAAYCAGKLSREAAWKAAYYRGYVSSKQLSKNGAMVAVGLDSLRLLPYIENVHANYSGELTIACYNSPQNQTVSGDEAMIDVLKELLDAGGVFARKLNVKNAYHSSHMEQIAGEYLQLMGDLPSGIKAALPHVHIYSTVSGLRIEEQENLNANYWVKNLLSPVQFKDALTGMCFDPITKGQALSVENNFIDLILEIGPHSALQSVIKETVTARESQSSIECLSVLNRNISSVEYVLDTIGMLSSKGALTNIQAINESSRPSSIISRMLVDLPPYSFNHSSKVVYESRLSKNLRFRKYPRHDLFEAPVPDWNVETPRWRHFIRLDENPWLKDHLVGELLRLSRLTLKLIFCSRLPITTFIPVLDTSLWRLRRHGRRRIPNPKSPGLD
jgi:acyl transferase domain-containing protein